MKNLRRRLIPKNLRLSAINILTNPKISFVANLIDTFLPGRDKLTPPLRIRVQAGPFLSPKYYTELGKIYLKYFKTIGFLKNYEDVLDVGCGSGEMANALATYLSKESAYEGFDIIEEMIEWCSKNISPRYPNFRFRFFDLYSSRYNLGGKLKASSFKFPYQDEAFDFIILKSVFTHMLPKDLENYFFEIHRTLKKGGRCFMTFFLLNDESKELIAKGKNSLDDFRKVDRGYFTTNEKVPESAVAYQENFISELIKRVGFPTSRVYYGSWCGRRKFMDFQDIIVATK